MGLPQTRAITDMVFPSLLPAGIPIGCFHSLGVQLVSLPKGTISSVIKVCTLCITVQVISRTKVEMLHMHTFAHCQHLEHIFLPSHLKEISAEAFEACSSLCKLALLHQLCCWAWGLCRVQQAGVPHLRNHGATPASC